MRTRVLAIALALALTACSGGGDDSTDIPDPSEAAAAASDGVVTFVGTTSLRWEETTKSATVAEDGLLEVTIVCDGAVLHNVVFEGVNDDAIIAECAGDDRATATLQVEPGTYTYYCAIPGHRGAGMEGELTLE